MYMELIGVSDTIVAVKAAIRKASLTETPALVTGEAGTGKELIVRNLYRFSTKQGKPFVKIDCPTLAWQLAISQEAGSGFQEHYDRLRTLMGDGGVVFFDHLHTMRPHFQEEFLQAIHRRTSGAMPEGAMADAWFLAAATGTRESLDPIKSLVREAKARGEIASIHIPPLRMRREDVAPLVLYYLDQYSGNGKWSELRPMPPAILESLRRYSWPGNVRELQNYVKRVLVTGDWRISTEILLGEGFAPVTQAAYPMENHPGEGSMDDGGEGDYGPLDEEAISFAEREIIACASI